MKRCPACGETKSIDQFYAANDRCDGLSGNCILCSNAASAASFLKLKLEVLDHLGGCCTRCGYDTPGPALQIDHVDGSGANERRADPSPRRILRDALNDTEGRYQLLCANCNQIKRIENAEHKGSRVYTRNPDGSGLSKYCAGCTTTKPRAEFHRNKARRDGLSVYCGPCTVKRTGQDLQELRRVALAHLGGRCADCGCADRRALQIDHVAGDGNVTRKAGLRDRALYRAVMADEAGRYQLLCANCNVLKKVSAKEFRQRDTYVRKPVERRPTRLYLSPEQIAEVARLVAVEGVPQADVGERYGITQSVVAVHVKNCYPDYNGKLARWVRFRAERAAASETGDSDVA